MADNANSSTSRSVARGGGRGRGRGGFKGRGGRGGRGDSRGGHQKKELGRKDYNRKAEKRDRNEEDKDDWSNAKRQRVENSKKFETPFTNEEIENEKRQPKFKVAVMVGYAGTGYKGLQISFEEKTIEGDIFKAFVAAGAISKANADDPKKSSLVRCARTDKGVHAAGNVLSLKLIIQDPKIVDKINENLPPQIRIWGIERTMGSFNCYQLCDSRWYEYLIPTYSFIPPHPESFLGKKLLESAEKEGTLEAYKALQEDVADFWQNAEKEYVQPILDKLDPKLAAEVMLAVHDADEVKKVTLKSRGAKLAAEAGEASVESVENAEPKADPEITEAPETKQETEATEEAQVQEENEEIITEIEFIINPANPKSILTPLEKAIKEVKVAYIQAKKAFRIHESRRARLQEALNQYVGTNNFHNYTILKKFSDPSCKRHMKTFQIGPNPIIIEGTEWLSLKVHGQSFMMHQIRKMVAMAALVVRCGSPMKIIKDSYTNANLSIPKAPSLGLLLEAPVFSNYNKRIKDEEGRESVDFEKYREKMDKFKQEEIYNRIFRVENTENQFHTFFHHIDHHKSDYFLWVTQTGLDAARKREGPGANKAMVEVDSEDEEYKSDNEKGGR